MAKKENVDKSGHWENSDFKQKSEQPQLVKVKKVKKDDELDRLS